MIYFIFGKPGAGKSTIGRNIAQMLRIPFVDCDNFYTSNDLKRIQTNTFTIEESDAFFMRFIPILENYHKQESRVIASQSLFRQAQRDELRRIFPSVIRLIYLDVNDETCLKRLENKRQYTSGRQEQEPHFYTKEQFLVEIQEYEIPKHTDLRIENNCCVENATLNLIQYINRI
ncbi:MAG: 6-phosphogluconate dehydrogenase, decarboxylating [Candidatus Gottesmanbacteria bacterium GW2011_GWA1_43_11]|uniref:6-phosphogluconate dehydrogenase, decarboxylating n=1 Tax=Candidatus Gottesmanbacteria bacterium GW2011_GWA1_43_11 TaxID=1618436 RepID=A0A0G1F8A4_9BACT|nr:MAG: 6-phosphogluconate dehydrogenase, decarboxylating [Candidatus Gottesmanbacteria bacterium GW2011_GWA1_43_11]